MQFVIMHEEFYSYCISGSTVLACLTQIEYTGTYIQNAIYNITAKLFIRYK